MNGRKVSDIDIHTIEYSIFDPTGNITALVETQIPEDEQPALAAVLMREHPEVEQVGFVRFDENSDLPVHLRMAGGEFCGNATMCAAALYLLRRPDNMSSGDAAGAGAEAGQTVKVDVAGVADPVRVDLKAVGGERASYDACVHMPHMLQKDKIQLTYAEKSAELVCVREQGITHLITDETNSFYELLYEQGKAEQAVRVWCDELRAEGLGLIFLSKNDEREPDYNMIPLVYVPASGTQFWEQACASGAAAVAESAEIGGVVGNSMILRSPGGIMRASRGADGEICLHARVTQVR